MRRLLVKPLTVVALVMGGLALSPNIAQAHDTDATAALLCEYFKPHTGDSRLDAHTYPDSHTEYDVFNCVAVHPDGTGLTYHFYFVTKWWNGDLTWTPGWWYCEDAVGNPYYC